MGLETKTVIGLRVEVVLVISFKGDMLLEIDGEVTSDDGKPLVGINLMTDEGDDSLGTARGNAVLISDSFTSVDVICKAVELGTI